MYPRVYVDDRAEWSHAVEIWCHVYGKNNKLVNYFGYTGLGPNLTNSRMIILNSLHYVQKYERAHVFSGECFFLIVELFGSCA